MNSFHPVVPRGGCIPPMTYMVEMLHPLGARVRPTYGERRPMAERWLTDEELREMSRPTMDRAIEALDRGDLDQARALCQAMKHEWRSLHDLMVEGIAGLISYVQDQLGDEGVAEAWRYSSERGWKRDVETIATMDRRA